MMHDRKIHQETEEFDDGTFMAAEGASVLLFCANDRDVNDNLAAWGIAGKGILGRNDEDNRHE